MDGSQMQDGNRINTAGKNSSMMNSRGVGANNFGTVN